MKPAPASLVAFDPGARSFAWARFDGGALSACGLMERDPLASKWTIRWLESVAEEVGEFVIEVPQVYRERAWKGDPNDLIDVAVTVGRIAGVAAKFERPQTLVRPHAWKGNAPKAIVGARILAKLLTHEAKILHDLKLPRAKAHNAVDAIGIGLWRLGRL